MTRRDDFRAAVRELIRRYGSASAIAREARRTGGPGCERTWQYWIDGRQTPQPANRERVIEFAEAER